MIIIFSASSRLIKILTLFKDRKYNNTMIKVLITLPNSIAGTLIMRGFKQGFKSNSCFVMAKDLRELCIEDVKRFKPDIIMGYDYGFLFCDNEELKKYILENSEKFKLVHYFADEPRGKYACVNKPHLYEEFLKINAYSFMWDRGFVKELPNCSFLPLAVNAKAYRLNDFDEAAPVYEISFVGRPLGDKRQNILAVLIKKFGKKLNIFSYEKHFLQSLDDMKNKQLLTDKELDTYKSAYRGFLTTEQELAKVYANSFVNINITLQGESGLNYRVFEVLASRGFLLTDDMGDIEKNFIVSKELETYKDVYDLLDKTEFYLKNINIAQKIATIGFADVYKRHSYIARAKTILEKLNHIVN